MRGRALNFGLDVRADGYVSDWAARFILAVGSIGLSGVDCGVGFMEAESWRVRIPLSHDEDPGGTSRPDIIIQILGRSQI
jgi:hypothetical protein